MMKRAKGADFSLLSCSTRIWWRSRHQHSRHRRRLEEEWAIGPTRSGIHDMGFFRAWLWKKSPYRTGPDARSDLSTRGHYPITPAFSSLIRASSHIRAAALSETIRRAYAHSRRATRWPLPRRLESRWHYCSRSRMCIYAYYKWAQKLSLRTID